jgi:hypothetical protein
MAISGGDAPTWGVEYHVVTRLSHVCRAGSLFALFQRERFAIVRRRHGCMVGKAAVPVPIHQTLIRCTQGGEEFGLPDVNPPPFARTYAIPSRFGFCGHYVSAEDHVAWLEVNFKIGSRSGRHVGWAHALYRGF